MSGDNALLCPPEDKTRLEAENGIKQLGYIEYLVTELRVSIVRESHILKLHKLAVEDIYPCGGEYRNPAIDVRIDGSRHEIPHDALVRGLVCDLAHWLCEGAPPEETVVGKSTYALWRLNWIHPFAGANGRTARALCYLVICASWGLMLKGVPSLPTMIESQHKAYTRALRVADKSQMATGDPDLDPLFWIVGESVLKQLEDMVRRAKQT